MTDTFTNWAIGIAVFERLLAIGATLHAVLRKRETSSVIGWVGLIWLSPLIGSLLYCGFGVNRIERKGMRIKTGMDRILHEALLDSEFQQRGTPQELAFEGRLDAVARKLTGKPLLVGNSITPLAGGDLAYNLMLEEIESARMSVGLCSYIFDYDRAGRRFVDSLERAHRRGVKVRVLIDDVGSRYSKPTSTRELRRREVPVANFLPTLAPGLARHANLRNHRKILVVDGRIGFTGGMNIREGCCSDLPTKHPVQDLHFRIQGPVVTHMQDTFVSDWLFVTGEELDGPDWFAAPELCGDILARGVPDGPDDDIDQLRLMMLAGLDLARHRVDIVTPYFLPDDTLVHSLALAAMRGVSVRVVLPRKNNLPFVRWASMDPIAKILKRGCEVYETDPPFDHTKIMLVDDEWTLIGSSNWDPRSLRLNFEFNIECYGENLAHQLGMLVDQKVSQARPLTLADLRGRPFPTRVRDGIARLAIPYL